MCMEDNGLSHTLAHNISIYLCIYLNLIVFDVFHLYVSCLLLFSFFYNKQLYIQVIGLSDGCS